MPQLVPQLPRIGARRSLGYGIQQGPADKSRLGQRAPVVAVFDVVVSVGGQVYAVLAAALVLIIFVAVVVAADYGGRRLQLLAGGCGDVGLADFSESAAPAACDRIKVHGGYLGCDRCGCGHGLGKLFHKSMYLLVLVYIDKGRAPRPRYPARSVTCAPRRTTRPPSPTIYPYVRKWRVTDGTYGHTDIWIYGYMGAVTM